MRLKNLKIDNIFMTIITATLVISLIYIAFYNIPEYKKQSICWDYFFKLKERAGLRDLTGFSILNETEEILKWGGYFNELANKQINKARGYEKLCVCVCDEV